MSTTNLELLCSGDALPALHLVSRPRHTSSLAFPLSTLAGFSSPFPSQRGCLSFSGGWGVSYCTSHLGLFFFLLWYIKHGCILHLVKLQDLMLDENVSVTNTICEI